MIITNLKILKFYNIIYCSNYFNKSFLETIILLGVFLEKNIQWFLFKNKAVLKKKGFLYLQIIFLDDCLGFKSISKH